MGMDTVQLENAVSTISQEYLLEFTSEYGIPEDLHPELPGPEDTIVDFLEVIGAAKVSHFEISYRVLNIIPTLPLFRVFYVPSYNSGWMSFSKRSEKNTPQCYIKPLDSLKTWNNRFFLVDERVFPTVVDWRTSAPKDGMPTANSYSSADVTVLDTRRTPIQKQPEALLCLVGLSQRYFLGDDVYPTFLYNDDRDMDLFNLISTPNPAKVKTGSHPRAAHEVSLLTVTANCVIDMEDPVAMMTFSETPSVMEKSPLDFSSEDLPPMITNKGKTEDQAPAVVSQEVLSAENIATMEVVPEVNLEKEITTMRPLINKKCRKRDRSTVEEIAPPNVLRKDYASVHPTRDTRRGEIASCHGSRSSKGTATEIPTEGVATTEVNVQFSMGSPESGISTSAPSIVGSPNNIYQPVWGVTNDCHLDTPKVCQDMVDHTVPSGYFSELRHLPNTEFLAQYNINLAWKVALGSQLRLRFEQEVRLLKKDVSQVARRNERIQVREEEIKRLGEEVKSLKVMETEVHGLHNQTKNLETLLEAEVDMKKATEAKNAELAKELESLRAKFSNLQLNNNQLSQQVSTLQAQVTGKERIEVAFKEFKKYEDNKVEQRCAEMDARLDKLSVDIDEELYPHILMVIVGYRWVIGHGLCLTVMKYAGSLEIRQAFANVVSAGLAKDVEAYDPEANNKLVKSLQDLKDLKYPMIDQLEKLKDAPIELIMASLHLESDNGEDAPQSDSILALVPTIVPQGLAILLIDAGAIIQRDVGRYYPKRYWEILPKEILGDTTQRDIEEILGDTTQRDIGRYYPKRYWEILPKEILGDTTQRDIEEILGDTTQRDIEEILGDTTQRDIEEILGDTTQRDISMYLGNNISG
ncbi:hypothetical protein Tco_1371158 [Tanacetum coccineum]